MFHVTKRLVWSSIWDKVDVELDYLVKHKAYCQTNDGVSFQTRSMVQQVRSNIRAQANAKGTD